VKIISLLLIVAIASLLESHSEMSSPGLSLPLIQQQTSYPAPIESAPTSALEGVGAAAASTLESSLGASGVTAAIGVGMENVPGGNRPVPHDTAVKLMKDQNYDPGILPTGDISAGRLSAIMNQQSIIAKARNIASRSGAPDIAKDIAGLGGGIADPLFLAAGPVLGKTAAVIAKPLEAAVGGGRLLQAGLGATEASGTMAAYTKAQQQFGTSQGDRDISSYDTARQVTIAALLGGGFGALSKAPVNTNEISGLERSAAAAKVQGVPVSEVTSHAGAVGEFQIMPSTAEAYGIPASALKDPKVNKQIAEALLTELNKKYPADPEAVAIAYNDGPKAANKWLMAGRDDTTLKPETADYVKRFREMRGISAEAAPHPEGGVSQVPLPPDVMAEAGKTAVTQFMADAPIDVRATAEDALEHPDGLASSRALAEDDGLKAALNGEKNDLNDEVYRTNPFKIRQEHEDEVNAMQTRGMQVNAERGPAQAEIDQQLGLNTAEATVTPEEHMLAQARQEAAAFGPHTTGEQDPEFVALEEKMRDETSASEENSRGLEAAMRCGAIRGFS
jgi:Transglycosylase SLT domain